MDNTRNPYIKNLPIKISTIHLEAYLNWQYLYWTLYDLTIAEIVTPPHSLGYTTYLKNNVMEPILTHKIMHSFVLLLPRYNK